MRRNLGELSINKHGVIVKVNGRRRLRQRLMDMGFVNGAKIQSVRLAPLGDPIEFVIKGYHISLRKNEAENIIIETEDE